MPNATVDTGTPASTALSAAAARYESASWSSNGDAGNITMLPADRWVVMGMQWNMALQRWQAEKGSYPATLDQLVIAGLLGELPMDPFGDGPLTYRRLNEGFTLYSFGTNLTDNGGKPGITRRGTIKNWTDNGDTVLWPVMD